VERRYESGRSLRSAKLHGRVRPGSEQDRCGSLGAASGRPDWHPEETALTDPLENLIGISSRAKDGFQGS
jgi:hypothetical protein